MRQAEQDVTVFLHLFTAFAQLLFGLAELLVRLYEFDCAFDHSFLERRIELTDFVLGLLAFRDIRRDATDCIRLSRGVAQREFHDDT